MTLTEFLTKHPEYAHHHIKIWDGHSEYYLESCLHWEQNSTSQEDTDDGLDKVLVISID